MKTLVGNVMRTANALGNGTMGVVEQNSYAKWYHDRDYVPFFYTVKYMSPVGMPRKYGFWAMPELYAKVLIGLPDNSNPNEWVYLGSIFDTPVSWDEDIPYYSTMQEKNLHSVVAPLQHAYATGPQSQAYGMITPKGNSFTLCDVNTNKGVFLHASDGKMINIHAVGSNPINDSIVIQNQPDADLKCDSITLTGPYTKKPIGPRGYMVVTAGNSITQSRGASIKILVGNGSTEPTGNGRELLVKNMSMAYGLGSKTQFEADNIPDLKAEGCGSVIIRADNNDVEIIAGKERILITSNKNCQIEALGDVKIMSKGTITLQSDEGDINLKALQGNVNIESGQSDVNIQSKGKIQLNKENPGSFDITEVEKDKLNMVELTERLDSGEIRVSEAEEG